MREMINYMIEANAALLLFLAFYKLLLSRETNFRFQRFFILGAVVVSLAFPLIHLQNLPPVHILTINQVVPAYRLPVVIISAPGNAPTVQHTNQAYEFWQYTGWIYFTGVMIFLTRLIVQLLRFLLSIRKADAYG